MESIFVGVHVTGVFHVFQVCGNPVKIILPINVLNYKIIVTLLFNGLKPTSLCHQNNYHIRPVSHFCKVA